ncbi:dihydrofolate reductase family protein [Larkinella terrae]|uniref:Bacterial bifunctional deaminase-reductase C-terminal domain-containing protein n=1 Tax=Larkinella terrae TaxID=2025311 RepID=A0A7K0EVW6_9BACT|nr:dihydrofolate reductase family protein [Larkinella terrae]MRS65927.1 hypothetical protein [Larkinella terrae]
MDEGNPETIKPAGKNFIVYGGSSFVSALIKEDLIDEFDFFINPVAVGKGWPIFEKLDTFRPLKLKKATVFDCGTVLLKYELG